MWNIKPQFLIHSVILLYTKFYVKNAQKNMLDKVVESLNPDLTNIFITQEQT
jgi:hypothetical protein